MTATIHQFPLGRRVRVAPRMMALYGTEPCQPMTVRNGLVQIARIENGAVVRMWVAADQVTMWEEIMAGHDPRPSDGEI